jgi:low affinity Fe/Cu permease
VKALAEKWGVKVAIAFGDDTTDLDMQTKLQELIQSGKLKFQAFVGVKHSKTPEKIMTDSTIVVEGQESSVGLLARMAKDAEYQTAAPAA